MDVDQPSGATLNTYLLSVVLTLLAGFGWFFRALSTRFDALIATDHVHRSEFIALEQRVNELDGSFNRLRGEFDVQRERS